MLQYNFTRHLRTSHCVDEFPLSSLHTCLRCSTCNMLAYYDRALGTLSCSKMPLLLQCTSWVACICPQGPGCGDPGDCDSFVKNPSELAQLGSTPFVPTTAFCASDGSWPMCVFPADGLTSAVLYTLPQVREISHVDH